MTMLAACKKDAVVSDACTTIASDEKMAKNYLQGNWKLVELYAGRAGKQPIKDQTELLFKDNTMQINENGKIQKITFDVIVELSGSLRLVPSVDLKDTNYYYLLGYLQVCESQLRVGYAPVDGVDYIFTKI